MRVAFFLAVGLLACTTQTQLGPAITCSDVTLNKSAGACDFVANSQCSDGHFYAVDCQDDGTCSCSVDSNLDGSFLAADGTTQYCSSVNAGMFHQLAANCGLNLNP